ncbi:hypothetical protein [Microlunatus parietis]|uniref:Lipoprotein LpqN n=1 Tax=Microlunatus parietis TaxID=682979 RepID=A0A7Y9IA05_9ACTN|nr:hypothetical protein [Microlunatus parietis]NYE73010.1 hypothetical protein [Microlunatus parietis]
MASRRLSFMIIFVLLTVVGCSQPQPVVPGPAPGSPIPSVSQTTEPPAEKKKETAVRNDLRSGKLSHRLETDDLELRVEYRTTLPTREWTAGAIKPFRVTASASTPKAESQPKIYLSKLTIGMNARDDTEPVEAPDPEVDEAPIVPGFLISTPASYGQEFFLPALPPGTRTLTLRLRYELLLASTGSSSQEERDYSRRTVTDLLVVPIAAP